jgi:excisionase family DNA binding protein
VLTLDEAAALLRVEAAELVRLAEQQDLPARRIDSSWRFSCGALMAWLEGQPERLEDPGKVTAMGAPAVQVTPPPSTAAPEGGQQKPIGEAPEEPTAERVLLRAQRVLLGPGRVALDFGQYYSRNETLELASVQDLAELVGLEQETLTTLFQARVGVFDETELFVGALYYSQASEITLRGTRLASSERFDVANIGFGFRRTLLREGTGRPDIIASLDAGLPSDGSSYAIGGGVVVVKSIDPVVLFASAHYSHTFIRDSARESLLEPEARSIVSVGYGLALNDTVAISTTFSGAFAAHNVREDGVVRQPLFSARFGLTSRIMSRLFIEPSVSYTLSGSRSGFAMGVTLPYAF